MTDVVHYEISIGCNAHFRDAFKPILKHCLETEADVAVSSEMMDTYTLSTLTVASCWVHNLRATMTIIEKGLTKVARKNPDYGLPLVKCFSLKLGCRDRAPLAAVAAALIANGEAALEFASLGGHGEEGSFEDKHILFVEGARLEDLRAAVAALHPENDE